MRADGAAGGEVLAEDWDSHADGVPDGIVDRLATATLRRMRHLREPILPRLGICRIKCNSFERCLRSWKTGLAPWIKGVRDPR